MKVINNGHFNLMKINSKPDQSENSSIQILGNNNEVFIESRCSFKNIKIIIRGDNNKLHIKRGAWFLGGVISIIDNSSVIVGERSSFGNNLEVVTESAMVRVGDDCKVDSGLILKTTNIHGLYSLIDQSVNINEPEDIIIDDYVWIRKNVMVMQGSHIASGNVIESRAVFSANSDLFEFWSGNPATRQYGDILWSKSAHLDKIVDDRYAKMYIDKYYK